MDCNMPNVIKHKIINMQLKFNIIGDEKKSSR